MVISPLTTEIDGCSAEIEEWAGIKDGAGMQDRAGIEEGARIEDRAGMGGEARIEREAGIEYSFGAAPRIDTGHWGGNSCG